MADAVRRMSPEDLAANRAMVRDLDRLLQQQLAGAEPDPGEFLAKHGSFFPGATTVEEIIEQLAQRMSAMQSLLRSLTAAQRSELNSLVDGLLRDDRLRWDLAQLAATLDQVLPDGLGERFRFGGDEELGLEGALGQLETLGRLEALEGQLDEIGAPGRAGRDRPRRPARAGRRGRRARPRPPRRARLPARGGRLPHPGRAIASS